ncbi:MAG TPA: ParA family protein [Nitrososphaeraceae archaeon]|nr:ParA family protein [Nitrososphaeraceae archaeon]
MTKCVAFHSYKGGTGKTTLAGNFAAVLAKSGFRVCLLDLDVYAPSLQSYFTIEPRKWINDYLYSDAEIGEVMQDLTPKVSETILGTEKSDGIKGKLWVGFCNAKKEEIYKLEGGADTTRKQFLRRFILLREQLITTYDADYIVIDTSPGIRYWSINALAVADILFLTLKAGDLDIEGTKKMAEEIYSSFTKFGTKSFLLLNRVAGYCAPSPLLSKASGSNNKFPPTTFVIESPEDSEEMLAREVRMKIMSSIPCYCDIQFLRKEFLTALKFPSHPFAMKIESLIEALSKTEVH